MEENYKKRAMRFWGKCHAGLTHASHLKPGTKEFFEEALKKRFSYETEWLLEIMNFSAFKNRRVIEVG